MNDIRESGAKKQTPNKMNGMLLERDSLFLPNRFTQQLYVSITEDVAPFKEEITRTRTHSQKNAWPHLGEKVLLC